MAHHKELLRAVDFAAQKHRDQRRKDEFQAPYINHPIAVATLIAENTTNPGHLEYFTFMTNVLCAAVLHDTLEDTDTTPDELRIYFNSEIASLVEEVTDDKSLPKGERKRCQLENIANKTLGAQLIKMADKYSNCYDAARSVPPTWSLLDAQGYFAWSRAMILRIPDRDWYRPLRNAALEETIGDFVYAGETVPRVPVPDRELAQFVEKYLKSIKELRSFKT